MNSKLIVSAIRISRERLKNHPEFLFKGYIHFSFLILRGKLIAIGLNHRGNNPIQYGYPTYGKIHSEIDSYRKAKGLLKGDSFSLINIRLGRRGILRNSKPCLFCQNLLKELNCKEICYSTERGFDSLSINP